MPQIFGHISTLYEYVLISGIFTVASRKQRISIYYMYQLFMGKCIVYILIAVVKNYLLMMTGNQRDL